MTFGELNVEERDKSLEKSVHNNTYFFQEGKSYLAIVIPLQLELEGAVEGDVRLGAGLDVDLLDEAGVGDHLIPAHTSGVLKFSY